MSTSYNILKDKELFENLGRALYVCQLLELNLAHIIKDLHILKGKIKGNHLFEYLQELERILDSRLKRTLGNLFGEIRKLAKLDDESERLLKKALENRNEIVHHFFYKHFIVVVAPVARYVMIRELKDAIETITGAFELSERIKQKLKAQKESDTDNSSAPG
ncbi:MAG: hypothetical protein ACYSW7_09165 [Planctomycetota bacterium]|jgi:hypothetical protein